MTGRTVSKGLFSFTGIAGAIILWTAIVWLFFTSSAMAGARYELTSDSLPYYVKNHYDTIAFAGTKITSPTDGIIINGRDHVYFDLGDDTLVFGTSGEDSKEGIFVGWNSDYTHINGGTIIYDPGDPADSAKNGVCIYLANSDYVLLENMNLIVGYGAIDARCVSNNSGGYGIEISGGTMRSESVAFTTRADNRGSVIRYHAEQALPVDAPYHISIHDLTITDGPHSGIAINKPTSTAGTNKVMVYNNHITTDSRDSMYTYDDYYDNFYHTAADAYGISLYGISAGSHIYNNVIRSGNDHEGNLGILVQMSHGTESDPVLIYDNDVHTWQGPNGAWPNHGKCNSLYWRNVPGEAGTNSFYTYIYDNIFKCTVDNDPSTSAMGSKSEVVSIFWEDSTSNNIFERNRVELVAKNGILSDLHEECNAIGFSARDTLLSCCENVKNNIFRNNRYISFRTPVNFSGQRGYPGSNIVLHQDTIECTDLNADDSTTFYFGKSTAYRDHALGNRVCECVYLGSANDNDVVWSSVYSYSEVDSMGCDVRFERAVSILVENSSGDPVFNSDVWLVNNYGDTLIAGTTDINGEISGIATYKYFADDQVPDDGYYIEDSLEFNDFLAKAKYSGDSAQTTFTITSETSFPITLVVAGGAGTNTPPTTPTASSPANGGTVTNLSPALIVNNSSDADGDDLYYHFQVSLNSSFTSIVAQNSAVSEGAGSLTSWSVAPDLTDGDTYYWRVRAYDGSDYSGWSSTRSFNVDLPNNSPSTPTASAPSNGATVAVLNPQLTINNSSDVDGDDLAYDFQVSSNSGFTSIVAQINSLDEGVGSTTSWTVSPNLTDGNTYYWRARAYDGEDYSGWSSARTFTIDLPNNIPSTPTLASPANGGTVTNATPLLTCNNSSDADGDNLVYHFQVSSNSGFTVLVAQVTSQAEGAGSTTSWTVNSALTDGNTYYWRVRAYDGEDYSGWASYRSFLVDIPNNVPSTPTLASPANGSEVNVLTPDLSLNNSSDSDGDVLVYTFQVSTSSSFTNIVAQVSDADQGGGSTTSWTVSPDLSDGSAYYWRARAYDGEDYSGWSSSRTFGVNLPNNAPSAPTLASPSNGATVTTLSPVLTANNSSDPDNDVLVYHFQISASSSFSSIAAENSSVNEGGGTTTAWTVSPELSDNIQYYWRVRAYDGENYSSWSSSRTMTVDLPNNAPSTPTLASPENGFEVNIETPILTFNNSSDSDGDDLSYHIQVSTNTAFSSVVAQESGLAEGAGSITSWTVTSALNDGSTYYWRVRAYDGEDYSSWSSYRSFTINLPNIIPGVPVLYSPGHASIVADLNPLLTIENVTDPDGDVVTYEFQVSPSASFSPLSAQSANITKGPGATTSWQVNPELADGSTYYWRARSYDGKDHSDWSSPWTFTVQLPNNPPTVPVPAGPSNGAQVSTLAPELIINNSSDADGENITYHFQVSTNSNFTSIAAQAGNVAQGSGSSTSWTVNVTLNNNTNYWWRVRAYDGEDYSSYSQTWLFYTNYSEPNDPPSPPDVNEPPDGGTVDGPSPVLIVNNSADSDGDDLTYHFEVWNNSQSELIRASAPIPEGSGGTTSWQVDTVLDAGESYSWRARSFDGNEYADWMGWAGFNVPAVNSAPETPIVYLPDDGDTLVNSSHNLVVFNSADADGDDLTYSFRIASDAGMGNIVEQASNVSEGLFLTTSYTTISNFNYGQTYYWQARAFDGQEYSSWTAVSSFVHLSFSVDAEDVPVPVAPLAGDIVDDRKPRFVIQTLESDQGVNFYFEVADNPEFIDAIVSGAVEGEYPQTAWSPNRALRKENNYYWRVRAQESDWCEAIEFLVGAKMHVYPNPFRPAEMTEAVTFRNLPDDATVIITDVNGDVVREFANVQGNNLAWNVTNSYNNPLASGVYLYFVSSDEGTSSGKFAVIR